MTVRSEGQFNTVVYEDEDIYRGQERRDVIMMAAADIERLGLLVDEPVTVRGPAGERADMRVRSVDIRAGNAAMCSAAIQVEDVAMCSAAIRAHNSERAIPMAA